ncbi:MAG: archaetidylserine decarboxylase, partial [Gammaproteobacteria bacterium]|nr:archaetidylserine decarboxylase [Gammaproteobacteria bacterium]
MNNSNNETAGLLDFVKAWPQYILPHYALSNLMHALTRSKTVWWKNFFIRWFIKQYKINMSEANPSDPSAYASFNEFFTRPLQTQARPIAFGDKHIVSPVDGAISQSGDIVNGNVFQAKGRSYTLHELLAGEQQWVDSFNNGHFATIYLSPKDYHRIHMPRSGHLVAMSHIPGRLFSVNPATTRAIPRLFARNERVIAYFETPAGPMAMILVGAIFVAGMETVWHGAVSPPPGR